MGEIQRTRASVEDGGWLEEGVGAPCQTPRHAGQNIKPIQFKTKKKFSNDMDKGT